MTVAAVLARSAVWHWLTEPVLGQSPEGRALAVRRWRYTSGIFLVYLAYAVGDMVQAGGVARIALGAVLIALFTYIYLGPLPAASLGGERRLWFLVLLSMPAIMVLFLAAVGRGGLVFGVYVAVAFVILLRPIAFIPLTAALFVLITWVPQHVARWDVHGPQWSVSVPVLLVAFGVGGLRSGLRQRIQLHRAEAEVARLAAGQERLRIARDLHDLLGHALTTITVKAELASKLAVRDPVRAAAEMAEVAVLGRQGLADVRATVAGYREVSLVTELASARQVLAAAGIQAELPATVENVPGDLRELFGWVLREGVTNAVRHSGARHLRVEVDARSIEVVDDGLGERAAGAAGGGNGLAGLAERAAAVGGLLVAGSPRDRAENARGADRADRTGGPGGRGWPVGFSLRVELP
ncbi:sensor histidine kinase [Parafrankia discariae]|uniref:sensor histidine kinase n=1 Tax=Parafrankia discariae TaxID=365528 RepID=UPI00036E2371|nr:histidine kinase [Parafrankia discariae]